MKHPTHKLALVSPADLRPSSRNARLHSKKQVAQIAASIDRFGFTNPILVNSKMEVIAGHARLQAAIKLSLTQVSVIKIDHLTEREEQALMLADNKLALNATWDETLLAAALKDLAQWDEVDLTGFSTAEVDNILSMPSDAIDPPEGEPAIDRAIPPVSKPGDLWQLGDHLIACGDALVPETYRRLMASGPARQAVTDFPYNVKVDDISGLGRNKHAEFAMASGEMDRPSFTEFLFRSYERMKENLVDGAILHGFMDWRHVKEIQTAGERAGLELKNICVWKKSNGGMGSLYRSQHELCFVFKYGTEPHVNNVELGKDGRYRTNVWEYAGANAFGRSRKKDLETHPTVKPLAMIMDAIKDCSRRGDVILDPFGGSGTTLLAAERTGRRGRLVEIDPYYVDATIRRFEAMTGRKAILSDTGEPFGDVDVRRRSEAATGPVDVVAEAVS